MIGSPLTWYSVVESSRDRLMTSFERSPQVKRDMDYFNANVGKAKTVDDLMKDRRLLNVVLSAFQLESEIGKTALVRKVISEPLSDEKALANRLADPRYKQLAEALQPWSADENPFADPKKRAAIIAGYKVNGFEKEQGERSSGMREIMYFKRMIGKVADLNQIMADRTLAKVTRVALGFPPSFGALDFEQQKARLAPRVDVEKFKDPAFVEKFAQRFLILNARESAPPAADPVLQLLQPAGQGGFQPIGIDFLI